MTSLVKQIHQETLTPFYALLGYLVANDYSQQGGTLSGNGALGKFLEGYTDYRAVVWVEKRTKISTHLSSQEHLPNDDGPVGHQQLSRRKREGFCKGFF
jgi:hypothetical protein